MLTSQAQRWRFFCVLLLLGVCASACGLLIGSAGLADGLALIQTLSHTQTGSASATVFWEIRLPRLLGTALIGALLGLAGALAQALFRNPLADPYLLGTAAGAQLGVVIWSMLMSVGLAPLGDTWLAQCGLIGAAFVGASMSVLLTLLFARGAAHPLRLLLTGVVVSVVCLAATDWITLLSPVALRVKQSFMLGSTALLGWSATRWLAIGLCLCLAITVAGARVLDALTLGDDTAYSLGIGLTRWHRYLIATLALATALAVAHAGLIAFVGLVAPQIVRHAMPASARLTLCASSLLGAVLLVTADGLARLILAPQELPVGMLTAVCGGAYLLFLLRQSLRPWSA